MLHARVFLKDAKPYACGIRRTRDRPRLGEMSMRGKWDVDSAGD